MSSEPASAKRKRLRARQACIPCRQRKRKCDGAYPCDMCTSYEYACQFPEDEGGPAAQFANRPRGAAERAPPTYNGGSPKQGRDRKPSIDTPDTVAEPGLIDLPQSRYMTTSSTAAFAQVLGQELQSAKPPRLHPYAYSFGVRPPEPPDRHEDLCGLVGADELARFTALFFETVCPVWGVLDRADFEARSRAYYDGSDKDAVFAGIIAMAVACASYLAIEQGHARETELVRYAKRIIDDPEALRRPSVDLVLCWLLRGIYLRMAASPNAAWLATSTAMHLVEANGLHDEAIVRRRAQFAAAAAASTSPGASEAACAERLRCIYWTAFVSNTLSSYEYGRSPCVIQDVTVAECAPTGASLVNVMTRLAKLVPRGGMAAQDVQGRRGPLQDGLRALSAVPDESAFVTMTKSDLCFAFYRRMRQLRISITPEIVEQIVAVGNAGLEASAACARERRPWFNAIGSTFQYACTLLAIDRPPALANVARAFQVLEMLVAAINTESAREALATARLLARDSIGKKRRELAVLEAVDTSPEAVEQAAPAREASLVPPQQMDLGLDWDRMFDQFYGTFYDSVDYFPMQ